MQNKLRLKRLLLAVFSITYQLGQLDTHTGLDTYIYFPKKITYSSLLLLPYITNVSGVMSVSITQQW